MLRQSFRPGLLSHSRTFVCTDVRHEISATQANKTHAGTDLLKKGVPSARKDAASRRDSISCKGVAVTVVSNVSESH